MSGTVPVALDAGPAVHQRAGLARYTERLAARLFAEQSDRIDLTLYYNEHSGHSLPASLTNIPARPFPRRQIQWRLGALASQIIRRSGSVPGLNRESVYHAGEHLLPYLEQPTVLTVHDLIFEFFPQHHTRNNRLFLKMAMPLFVRRADAIIAVSRQTGRDLTERYGTPSHKIHVIPEGVDDRFQPASTACVERVCGRNVIDRPYLLMVGTLEPRKNHATALEILARLKARGYPHRLVIAGGVGWLFEPLDPQVERLGLKDRVRMLGHVPDEDLPALYSGADLLLQPSLYEGFGFPILEAMACGTPVVSSDGGSLPELVGDLGEMASATDVDGLTAAVERTLVDPPPAERLREHASRFRWSTTAQQTAALYAALWRRR